MTRDPDGCRTERIGDARAWLRWVEDGDAPPEQAQRLGLKWLLAHCLDGVTWGYWEGGAWRLGCRAFPRVSPVPREETLLELRLFGPRAEVLLWSGTQGLEGRVLTDEPAAKGTPPAEEAYILLGDTVLDRREGFAHLRAATGAEQVVPEGATPADPTTHRLRLKVRHYFRRDPDTGVVRVTASRLVELYQE